MARKWFVHRSSEARRSEPPLRGSQGVPKFSGRAIPSPGPAPQVRTVVSIDRGDGSRKPRTIITIRRCRKPEQPAVPLGLQKQPQETPARLGPSPLASDRLMPEPRYKALQDDLDRCEELRQARGLVKDLQKFANAEYVNFGFPTSPSSTLRNDIKIPLGAFSPSFSYDKSDGQLSMSSIQTSITVMDDGLSPWGLPKTPHPYEEEGFEATADFASNPKSNFEAELASYDAGFGLVRESLAERSSLQSECSSYILLQKLQAIIYAAKLVVVKRVSNQRKAQLDREEVLMKSRHPSPTAGLFSTFASWI